MKNEIEEIKYVLEKLDENYYSIVRDLTRRLSIKDPFGDLTSTQLQAFVKISKISPCALSDVAKTLKTSKSSASTLVERLVQKGILERKQNPENRRRVLITIHQQARKFQKKLDEEIFQEIEKIAQKIGPGNFKKWHDAFHAINTSMDLNNL
jgi:DNA-binding MarR family transcriptional regulator